MTRGYRPFRLHPAAVATLAALSLAAAMPAAMAKPAKKAAPTRLAQASTPTKPATAPAAPAAPSAPGLPSIPVPVIDQTPQQSAAEAALLAARSGVREDLMSVYRDALANDSLFAAQRFQAQADLEKTPQARAALLPQVGLTGTANYNNIDGTSTIIRGDNWKAYGGGLNLLAPVYRPQAWETFEQSKLFVMQSEAALAQARQDLILRTAQAYFAVLTARDQLIYLEAAKKATLEQLSQAKREFEVGTKTIIDANEAQARYDQITAQEQVALGQLLVARSQLQTLIAREPAAVAGLRDRPNLQPPSPQELPPWVKLAEDSNYTVQIARAGTEIATRELQKAKDGYKPTLDVVGSYGYNRYDGRAPVEVTYNARGGQVGLQLNWPVFTGGFTQSRVRETLALDEKSRADLESARRGAANNARDAFTGVSFGLSTVKALESAEVSSKTQLESTQLGYQVGVRILLDVLNATTQLYLTQRDLKQARYAVLLSGLRLKATTAALTDEDVAAVNALLQ